MTIHAGGAGGGVICFEKCFQYGDVAQITSRDDVTFGWADLFPQYAYDGVTGTGCALSSGEVSNSITLQGEQCRSITVRNCGIHPAQDDCETILVGTTLHRLIRIRRDAVIPMDADSEGNGRFDVVGHGLSVDDALVYHAQESSAIAAASNGQGGLTNGATYYVVDKTPNTFRVSAVEGGMATELGDQGWDYQYFTLDIVDNGEKDELKWTRDASQITCVGEECSADGDGAGVLGADACATLNQLPGTFKNNIWKVTVQLAEPPSASPSGSPSASPSASPSTATHNPTVATVPTLEPTSVPSTSPSTRPSSSPSERPTTHPTQSPTLPSVSPTRSPTPSPAISPSSLQAAIDAIGWIG